jgi:PAS domain S-box-containing protein
MRSPSHTSESLPAVSDEGDGVRSAVVAITRDGVVRSWDDGAAALFGVAREEALGRSYVDLVVPPPAADEERSRLASAADAGFAFFESVRRRRDGLLLHVEVSVRASAHLVDGAPLLVLTEHDITRVRYLRDAQSLQARFRGVLEAAPDAMVTVDASGRITLVNSQTERLFGYPREELLGRPIEMLIPERFVAAHPGHREHYFRDPHRRPMGSGLRLAARRKDGSEVPVEISLSPVETEDGLLVTAAIRDITERLRLDAIRQDMAERRAAAEALAEHLERRVAERTAQLQRTNEELEAFTYSVSHDLRAPLRQVDGFARLLAEITGDALDPKARHYLRRIQDGAQQMGRLIDDLLRLSRVSRQDVYPRAIDLAAIVSDVAADMQSELAGREIDWRIGPLPTVECDPGLMKVVFTNLLSNAVKYTRSRHPAVIEVGQTLAGGRHAVYVRDNGVGFDMRFADKLFGVFQRMHRVDEFEGVGVGLATVKRVIAKHGGEIWADAAPDAGATFTFTLGAPPSPSAPEAA